MGFLLKIVKNAVDKVTNDKMQNIISIVDIS